MKLFVFTLLLLISAFAVRSEERDDQAVQDEDNIEDEGYENMNDMDHDDDDDDDEEKFFDSPEKARDNGVPDEDFDFKDDKKEDSNRSQEKPDTQRGKPDIEEPNISPPEEEEGSGVESLEDEKAHLRDALKQKLSLDGEPDEFYTK